MTFRKSIEMPIGPTSCVPSLTNPGLLVDRRLLSDPCRSRLEHKAFRRSSVPESYDVSNQGGHLLQSPCGGGVSCVIEDGRYWHLAGGIVAHSNFVPELPAWLAKLSETEQKVIAVYNVCRENTDAFRKHGFQANKFGEEAVLDLGDLTWRGSDYAWVRRQTNYCDRAGLTVEEVVSVQAQHALAPTLLRILREDFAGRTYDRPLRLLEGQFDPFDLKRRRLFVVRDPEHKVEAFLVCTPLEGGRGWAFETYRKSQSATRGAVPFLFRRVIDQLQEEGVKRVSLCLIPGKNLDKAIFDNEDFRVRIGLRTWNRHLNFMFNVAGQDYFKSRFRPRYIDRFVCTTPKVTIASILSFLKTTGAFKPNYKNLIKQLWSVPNLR